MPTLPQRISHLQKPVGSGTSNRVPGLALNPGLSKPPQQQPSRQPLNPPNPLHKPDQGKPRLGMMGNSLLRSGNTASRTSCVWCTGMLDTWPRSAQRQRMPWARDTRCKPLSRSYRSGPQLQRSQKTPRWFSGHGTPRELHCAS